MKRLLFTILFMFSLAPSSFAALAVTDVVGGLTQGNSVVITGTDFQVDASAVPLKWEDFEDGTHSQQLTQSGYWSIASDNDGPDKPMYSNANNRGVSTLNARVKLDSATDVFYRDNLDVTTSGYAYVDFWTRFDYGDCENGAIGDKYQIKLWRFIYQHPTYQYPSLSNFNWHRKTDGTISQIEHYYQLTREDVSESSSYSNNNIYNDNAWHHVQLAIYQGTNETADGSYKIWQDGALISDVSSLKILVDTGRKMKEVMFGEWQGNDGGVTTPPEEHFDDIYLNNTWSRVEVGNNATYADCTVRAIQEVTAWADTEITINFNQDAWTSGTKVYAFVVDQDGLASSGYEIEIGETGEPPEEDEEPSSSNVGVLIC